MPIQDFVSFGEGEKLIREYRALSIRKPMKLEGNVAITNKRAIIYGLEQGLKKSQLAMDIHLDVIKGVDIYHVTKPKWLLLIVGIIVAFVGLSMLSGGAEYSYYTRSYDYSGLIFGIVVLIFGIGLCATAFLYPNRMFFLEIKGEGLLSLTISREKSFWVLPGPDSAQMIREIGALILDTKLLGDTVLDNIDNRYPVPSSTKPTVSSQDLGAL